MIYGMTGRHKKPRICFFSNESIEQLQKEQYSIQDITILRESGCELIIATSFQEIPFGCDLYFSWWASGSILPLIKARISNKPIIVVAGGNEAMFYRDSATGVPLGYLAAPWFKKIATRMCMRYADKVLIVSKFMTDDVVALGALAPTVVHNSVNIKKFIPSTIQKQYVTSIFNMDEKAVKIKRGEVFIRSIPQVLRTFPDQKFIIIGAKQNAYEHLNRLARKLGIGENLDFMGSMDNLEVIKWLQASKAYVQISDTETFGVAIAEAMSCGVPVVVSRRGAIPELVGDCGVYVDQNDPESVAKGVVQILSNSETYNRDLGAAARKRIEKNYSYEIRKAKVQQILSGLGIYREKKL